MSAWIISASLLALGPAPGSATAADAITLRDGSVVLGQLVKVSPKGKFTLLVRRAWLDAHLPDGARRWRAAEATWAVRARRERRGRLEAWRKERPTVPGQDDPIGDWLDRELARPDDEQSPPSRLMVVELKRDEVRRTRRQSKDVGRLLRLGWRLDLDDAETLPLADLKSALEGRGFAPNGASPAPVDDLIPILPETDARWLARRAATELLNDRGVRFVQHENLVLPEGLNVEADGATALAILKNALADDPGDSLQARLREVAARGRVGVLVTRLDTAADLESVKVEATVWVRPDGDRWVRAGSRDATVRVGDIRPDVEARLNADPQVQAAFNVLESVGIGTITPELKQRSFRVGAATQKALGQARSAIEADLRELALPVTDL